MIVHIMVTNVIRRLHKGIVGLDAAKMQTKKMGDVTNALEYKRPILELLSSGLSAVR